MKKSIIFLLFLFFALGWQSNAQVAIGDGTETGKSLPIEPYFGYSYSQVIYLASEINSSGDITELTWDFAGTGLDDSNEWTIYVGHTTKSEFTGDTDWIDVSTLTQVFSGTISIDANNKVVVDITDFTYNGTDNLVIAVDENKDSYDGSSDDFYCTAVGTNRAIEYHADSTNPDPAAPPTANSGNPKAFIANIVLGGLVQTCLNPTDLTVTATASDSADISWTDNNSGNASYIVEWREAGTSAWNTASTASGETSYQITGLTPHTEYEWQVTADCGGGDTSGAIVGTNFWTACLPVSTFPYNYGFEDVPGNSEGDWSVSCWSANPENTGSSSSSGPYRWTVTESDTPSSHTGPASALSGTHFAFTEASGSNDGDVAELLSPSLDLGSLTTPQFIFNYFMYGHDMGTLAVDTYNGTTWTNDVWTISGQQQSGEDDIWMKVVLNLTNDITQIRFRATRGSDYKSDIAIDDITIKEATTCSEVGELVVNSVTENTADVSWTDTNNAATDYLVQWRELGATNWDSATAPAGSSTYQITGLTPHTQYEWQVSPSCANAVPTSGFKFWTACATVDTFPYTYGFEDVPTNTGGNWITSCWSGNPQNTDAGGYAGPYRWTVRDGSTPTSSTGPSAAYSGTQYAYAESNGASSGDEAELISPVLDLSSLTSPSLSFFYFMYGADMGSLSVDTYDGTTWTNDVWTIAGEQQTSSTDPWIKVYVDLPATTTQVRFRAVRGAGTHADIAVDEVAIDEAPSCLEASDLAVNNITKDSADFNWTDNSGGTATYIVEWREVGTTSWSSDTTAAGATSYQLTGLNSYTEYEWQLTTDCGTGQSNPAVGLPFRTLPDFCAGDHFYDTGGPNGNYGNSEDITTVIAPDNPGDVVKVTFLSIDIEDGYDHLYVYDGPDATATLLADLTGDYTGNLPAPFISSDPSGALTFVFQSDGSVSHDGWDAEVVCMPPATCPAPTDLTVANLTADTADLSWTDNSSGAASYVVEWREVGAANWDSATTAAGDTSYQLTGLTPYTTYEWQLTADCGNGDLSYAVPGANFQTMLAPLSNPTTCALGITIPDDGCDDDTYLELPLNVTAPGTSMGTDVALDEVKIIINHTYDGDLAIYLVSPSGVEVELSTDNGSNGDNYGDATNCPTDATVFSMNATDSIENGTAPFIGSYLPEGDFADFNDSSDPNGVWNLKICDGASGDEGTVEYVELVFATIDAVNTLEQYDFSFYPNPVENNLNISASQNIDSIQIFDILGQEVWSAELNKAQYLLDTHQLRAGTYIMKVNIDNNSGYYKFVKK